MPAHPPVKTVTFPIKDRLENGNLFVDEVCALRPCSRSQFYADVKRGLVSFRKSGTRSIVPGAVARKYLEL